MDECDMIDDSLWIYENNDNCLILRDDVFCWHTYSDSEMEEEWNSEVSSNGCCYLLDVVKINSYDVSLYRVSAINFFIFLGDGSIFQAFPEFNPSHIFKNISVVSVDRYIYSINFPEDPIYLEEQVEFRRIGKRLSFGRFKTKDDALKHADLRVKNIKNIYDCDDFISKSFNRIKLVEQGERLFGAYIIHKNWTDNMYGIEVDDMTMYNTFNNKFERFYKMKIPWIKCKMYGKRTLFEREILTDGDISGLDIYIPEKHTESIYDIVNDIRKRINDVFLAELIWTRRHFGIQDIPDETLEE